MSGRTAVVATLAIAFGMGLYSFVAIKRTAGRRVSLVEEVAASVPAIPGARVISPWEPATYADDVRAMYCLDGVDPTTGAARAINALTAAGWTTTETRRDAKADTFAFEGLRDDLRVAYATTVHKAQGAEVDHVALVLPERDVPLLSRELLYTALTRARHSAVVVGRPELLALAALRPLARASGLAARMGALLAPA